MKTKLLFLTLAILPLVSPAQPAIANAEDYFIGTTLKIVNCPTTGVSAGSGGAGQTWDFSGLATADTLTVKMLLPASTASGSSFPAANLVEKWSDGKYVYTVKTAASSSLAGFVDTISPITIHYPDPMLFAQRPITYGNTATDTFTDYFTSGSYNFSGGGISTLEADGYGSLVLPSGTYSNVLRIKISQVQNDTIFPFMTVSTTYTSTYEWFDGIHASPLLKIDSTHSDTYTSKSVNYLLSETTTGLPDPGPTVLHCTVSPNPMCTSAELTVNENLEDASLFVYASDGSLVRQMQHLYGQTILLLRDGLPDGMYVVKLNQLSSPVLTTKLVITH